MAKFHNVTCVFCHKKYSLIQIQTKTNKHKCEFYCLNCKKNSKDNMDILYPEILEGGVSKEYLNLFAKEIFEYPNSFVKECVWL